MPLLGITATISPNHFSSQFITSITQIFHASMFALAENSLIFIALSFLFGFLLAVFISFRYWNNKRKSEHQRLAKQIKQLKKAAAIRTAQSLTALFVQEISHHNNSLREWMVRKQNKGEQIPVLVKEANQNISQSLVNLSRLSYEFPYMQDYTRQNSVKKITDQSV